MNCEFCGAGILDRDAVMCPVCGEKKRKWHGWKRKRKSETPIPEVIGEPVEDGYDGYYNDVLPPDLDRINEGLDIGLIKNIILLCTAAIAIISLCVVMLYML